MRYSVWVHAFVLMSNHFHLIATTPNANLDRAMNYLMREVAKSINQSSGTINHLFGGSYKWSLLPTGFHYAHAIKYVYRNPVVAGMCARVEDYPYSTLAPLTSGAELKIPIVGCEFERHPYLAQPTQALLEFFNSPYNDKEAECIRRGIRKRKCIFVPLPGSRRLPPSLDSQSYPAPF